MRMQRSWSVWLWPLGISCATNSVGDSTRLFSSNGIAVMYLDMGSSYECMGPLLKNRHFTLTTRNCAKRMQNIYAKKGDALRVVYGQKKNNIECIKLYQDGNGELHDIALVKTYKPIEWPTYFDVPETYTSIGDECKIYLTPRLNVTPIDVTVKSHSGCENDEEGKLCVSLDSTNQTSTVMNGEGGVLVCGVVADKWDRPVPVALGLLLAGQGDAVGGDLTLTNVRRYESWITASTTTSASCGEVGADTTTDDTETTALPAGSDTNANMNIVMLAMAAAFHLYAVFKK